jgi:hypothetical protein
VVGCRLISLKGKVKDVKGKHGRGCVVYEGRKWCYSFRAEDEGGVWMVDLKSGRFWIAFLEFSVGL